MFITITNKRSVPYIVSDHKITHLLSTLDPGDTIKTPMEIMKAEHHLLLNFLDVEKPHYDLEPKAEHVAEVLEWAHDLKEEDRLLVHCFAGISRSTALALAIWIMKHGTDYEAARTWMKSTRSIACPNRLIAFYADEILNCKGKLLRLADEIGNEYLLDLPAQRNK